jgi:chromosome segregation ATPase
MSTPEERWSRIEDAIQNLLSVQAQHDVQIAKNSEQIGKLDVQIEKQNAAVRDLIVVSRTLIDAQQNTDRQLKDLAETMKTFLKNFPRPNGSH